MKTAEGITLQPLVDTLLLRLDEAGEFMRLPAPTHAGSFVRWYLEVLQLLEAQVARGDEHPPMTKREVELMCRAAATAATLHEAIELLADFSHMLHPRAGAISLVRDGGLAHFTLDTLRTRTNNVSRVVDIAGLHAFYQLFCWLTGQQINLDSLGVVHGSRGVLLPFLVLFDAPVLEEGDTYSFRFDEQLLSAPVVRTRGELQAFLDEYPCRIFGLGAGAGTRQQVMALLGAAVQQGSPLPGLKQVARVLDVSEITLRRRLKEEGTSYRDLRDACMVDAAHFHLERGERSIEEIATLLGFSDATAFRRSYKRCTGHAPSAHRRG